MNGGSGKSWDGFFFAFLLLIGVPFGVRFFLGHHPVAGALVMAACLTTLVLVVRRSRHRDRDGDDFPGASTWGTDFLDGGRNHRDWR